MTKARAVELNIALLRERFYVDAASESGLRMKIRSQPSTHNPKLIRNPGDVAGFKTMYGYWEVSVDKIYLKAHRVIWILLHGQIPEDIEVDHKDGNNSNNNPGNLQLLTAGANSRARNKLYATNKTGYVGVYPTKSNGWQSVIRRDKVRYDLGCFSTMKAAARRYNEFAIHWAHEHGETPRYLNLV